ncbi:MAG: tetratricopeptide repeat protein, partial [Myxococcota bacterium]
MLLLLAGQVGCATVTSPERVDADTLKIIVAGPQVDLFEVYDAKTLFGRGIDLMEGGAHAEAIHYFARVHEEFPESPLVIPAWFNRALCHLALEQGAEALSAIDTYIELLPSNVAEKHVLDGQFKRGAALMQLGRHEEAAEIFDILIVDTRRIDDQIEALVDSGVAHFMLNDRVTAEYRFLK